MQATTFEDIMKAMDAVDSLRHRESVVDTEVSGEERDRQMIAKLREVYSAQGTPVSDEVLKKSVASLNEKRFVHEPMKNGWRRNLAMIYVRRRKYGKRVLFGAIAAGFLIGAPIAMYKHGEAKRIAHELNLAREFDVLIAKTLPESLARATDSALRTAEDAGLTAQRSPEIHRRNADAAAAIKARNADAAKAQIGKIDEIRRSIEASMAATKLMASAEEIIKTSRPEAHSAKAKQVLGVAIEELTQAAQSGNESAYNVAKGNLETLVAEIKMPLTIKIVDRPDERSGVWRMKNQDRGTKQHYLVVEAYKPDGKVISRNIRNVETDRVENVKTWAVRVPETVYNTMAMEKRATGFISQRDAGVKKAGSLEIDWSIPTTGVAITRW